MGRITLDEEQKLVDEAQAFIRERAKTQRALAPYLERFGRWDPTPFK